MKQQQNDGQELLTLAPALLAVLLALEATLLPAFLGSPPPDRGLLTPDRGLPPPFLALLATLPAALLPFFAYIVPEHISFDTLQSGDAQQQITPDACMSAIVHLCLMMMHSSCHSSCL